MKLTDLPIVTVESLSSGLEALKLTSGPYEGIIYIYGKVDLDADEEKDQVFVKFEYEILDYADKGISDPKAFETYIGDILTELIHRGIAENDITYTGGVDENRNEDSSESYS